ncbi:hypothetical protein Tco_1174767 [Tanacetum coccineum]
MLMGDIESEDSYVSKLDEPDLLVTPLSKLNEDECFDPCGDVNEIELLLHRDPSAPKISVASILEGFTDEPSLEKNDDLFDLESKEDEWMKILYDAPTDDLMTEDKVFDPEIPEKFFSLTYLLLRDVAASFDSAVHRVHAVSFDAAVASIVSAACCAAAGYFVYCCCLLCSCCSSILLPQEDLSRNLELTESTPIVPADSLNSIPADNVPAGRSSSIPADYVSAGHVLVPADKFEKIKDIKVEDVSLTCDTQLEVFNNEVNQLSRMDDDLFTYEVKVANIPCDSKMDDDSEHEADDDMGGDDKDEIAEVFRIDTNIFDYETPLCSAFNEFNYLLKVDPDLLTKDIIGFKTYEDYKDVPWVDEKPWTNTRDYEWYEAMKDSKLKDEALRNKAIIEGLINEDDDESRYEQKRQ